MELNRKHFRAIIFYTFRRVLTQQQSIDELNSIFGDEAPLRSTEVVAHSKTNFVKVVQDQLLFRKPLTLCANWYCKIVMWPIVRLTTLGISETSIHLILHEHLFALDPTQFVNGSKKGSCQTTAFLNIQNIDLMSHPSYSPDLAPNDFFLFP